MSVRVLCIVCSVDCVVKTDSWCKAMIMVILCPCGYGSAVLMLRVWHAEDVFVEFLVRRNGSVVGMKGGLLGPDSEGS